VKMDQLCRGKLRTIAGNMAKSCLGCKPMWRFHLNLFTIVF
jgi:hypothetical protein